MSNSGIPEEVRTFIRQHVSSIEQLEILLHLYETSPTRKSASEIAEKLYLSPESTARTLTSFRDKKIVSATQGMPELYCVDSRTSDVGRSIEQLAKMYRERRVSVINEIFSNPISTIQTFADAFIIGKKKE